MIARTHQIAIMSAFIFLLTACISTETPPESWPTFTLQTGSQCADLSGTYANSGKSAEGNIAWPLALRVFPIAASHWTESDFETSQLFREASHVTFTGPNKKGLTIEAWKEDTLIGKIEREAVLGDNFNCIDGILTVSLPVYAEASAGIFFNAFRKVQLFPATDGSLIVKTNSSAAGLGCYVVPLLGQFETWSLYPDATSEGKLNP